ncbi:MAG: glycosyltransferase family 9 protein [Longimicrobiales bacterium]
MTANRVEQSDAPRVCIVLLTGLGDVVHGLPVANALKRAGLASHLTWVTEPAPSHILRHHRAVDDVVVYRRRQGVRGVLQLARDMAPRRFDLTLNLHIYFKGIWPTVFSRAPRRIGFDRARSYDGVWLFVNEHLPARPRAHTQDQFLEFLELLQVPSRPVEWNIEFTAAEKAEQAEFMRGLRDRPVVAVVPASANSRKDWLADRYARLIDALAADFGARAVLVGGPSARERHMVDAILTQTRAQPIDALDQDVRRMMWLLDGSDLVIAPDTGPLHIARACNVPVIGLYGHTNPWRVGPYQKYTDLWVDQYTDPGTAPDPSNRTPKWGRMESITVEMVLEKVDVALRRYRPEQVG